MTIKNFLENRGWSCDWLEVKSGKKRYEPMYVASKNGLYRIRCTTTALKIACMKVDELNLKNKI